MKRKQIELKVKELYWLLGRKLQLSIENKLLIYKTIIKPIWTYGIQIWAVPVNRVKLYYRNHNQKSYA